jgi:hypothetical protein
MEEINVGSVYGKHDRCEESEIFLNEDKGSAGPFACFHGIWDSIEPYIFRATGLTVFTKARACEYPETSPVKNGCNGTEKSACQILGGLNEVIEGCKHGASEGLYFGSWF